MPKTLLLIVACWGLLAGLACERSLRCQRPWDWRLSVILGSIAWGALTVLITELLSAWAVLQRGALLAAWAVAFVVLAGVYMFVVWRRPGGWSFTASVGRWIRGEASGAPFTNGEVAILSVVAVQVLLLAAVACIYPPNNYDSINYHMARVMHWEQNRSVAFFETSTMMEVRGAPFAEYVISHLQLLTAGDRYANLVQWFAMVLSAIGVSQIAAELGAKRAGQFGAALLVVSIPMGILQATSTQNDYVLASWMVCFTAVAMRLVREPRSVLWLVATGLAMGLAILTKSSALMYLPPFCLLVAGKLLASLGRRAIWRGLAIAALAATLTGPFFARMQSTFGSPMGPSTHLSNEILSLPMLASNTIRGIAIHVPFEFAGATGRMVTTWMQDTLRFAHAFTGLSPVDPRTTLTTAYDPFQYQASMHEDLAGNPIHAALALLAFVGCVLAAWRRRGEAAGAATPRVGVLAIVMCLATGFLLFNVALKWQVWHSRLHLPLFVVGMAPAWLVLFEHRDRRWLLVPIAIGLIAFRWSFGNVTRPVDGSAPWGSKTRTELYYANRPDLMPTQTAIMNAVAASSCREIGLYIQADPYEYAIWMLLKERGVRATIRHVQVDSPTAKLAPRDFKPCAVVSAGGALPHKGGFTEAQFGTHYLYLAAQ